MMGIYMIREWLRCLLTYIFDETFTDDCTHDLCGNSTVTRGANALPSLKANTANMSRAWLHQSKRSPTMQTEPTLLMFPPSL
jgi:hypothetical protein